MNPDMTACDVLFAAADHLQMECNLQIDYNIFDADHEFRDALSAIDTASEGEPPIAKNKAMRILSAHLAGAKWFTDVTSSAAEAHILRWSMNSGLPHAIDAMRLAANSYIVGTRFRYGGL